MEQGIKVSDWAVVWNHLELKEINSLVVRTIAKFNLRHEKFKCFVNRPRSEIGRSTFSYGAAIA